MFDKARCFATASVLALACGLSSAQAGAILPGFDANTLAPNDDGSTGAVNIGFSINFFGVVTNTLYVNNNGNVTLDSPLGTYTPFDLTSTGRQIIAPFFADVDTSSAGSPVTYGTGTVGTHAAFGVNWVNVDYFPSSSTHTNRNSFQLVLINFGGGDFNIEFNYDQIQWEAGEASGGDANGLGGQSARAGFSNGTGHPGTYYELPGSAVNGAFLDSGPVATSLIHNSVNSDVPGRYIFFSQGGMIAIRYGNDDGYMAAETALASTKAQSEGMRQTVRANHAARQNAANHKTATDGMSSMVATSNSVSTPRFSTWARMGGGVVNADFGGSLDVSHFAGQVGLEYGFTPTIAVGMGVGGITSKAQTSTDKLDGDGVFLQPYVAYVKGPMTAVASLIYTHTNYDDSTNNIDSGNRYAGSLSLAYAMPVMGGVTAGPFGYVAGGTEKFDVAGGNDTQDFMVARAGVEVSRTTDLLNTGTLHAFAAAGPEYVNANVISTAGPLTLTNYDNDRLGGYVKAGFEFTISGTDARLSASATGSGLFTQAPGISGEVGLSIPF